MQTQLLYEKKIKCGKGSCNNGCLLMKIAESNKHKLGGIPETEFTRLSRYIKVEGITPLDIDGEMIGEGVLEIYGKKQLSHGNKEYCHLIIKKSEDNGNEYYFPVIEEFKKIPSA